MVFAARKDNVSTARDRLIGRLLHMLGLDFHIINTLLLRGWSIMAGVGMIVLVPLCLTKVEQGYYYTFASLLALQIFFELGMNQIVVQLVSHEAASLTATPDGGLAGDSDSITRLASLVQLLRRWYVAAAILFVIFAGASGAIFFGMQNELPSSEVLIIWGLLILCTAGNLYLSPSLAVLEGFGEVGQVARLRLAQSIVGYALLATGLACGLKLKAVPLLAAASVICTAIWLMRYGSRLAWLRAKRLSASDPVMRWRQEIWPFQWRIALSWMSGYFILQLFVPMTFAHRGATEAGRLGISLSVFNAVLTIGLSWINAKVPTMSAHIVRREGRALNRLFSAVVVRTTIVTTLASLAVVAIAVLLPASLRDRFSDMPVLACLATMTIATSVIYAAATYMRAHKEEPMLTQSIVMALITVPVVYFGSMYSVLLMMSTYTTVVLVVSLPWALLLFYRYYRRHSQ